MTIVEDGDDPMKGQDTRGGDMKIVRKEAVYKDGQNVYELTAEEMDADIVVIIPIMSEN